MSLSYIKRFEPQIIDNLRIIGRSIISPAPPFVTHKDNPVCSSSGLISALNSALKILDQNYKDILNIKRFSFVPLDKYNSLINQRV